MGSRFGVLGGGTGAVPEVYKGCWLGQLVQWMQQHGIVIRGEEPMEGHISNDVML